MKTNKKPLIAIALLVVVGIVGVTIAYFTNSETFENLFGTKTFSTTIKENFESPDNWLPGTTTDKTVEVENKGNVPVVVRAKIENHGWYTKNESGELVPSTTLVGDKEMVTINTVTDTDANWTKVGDYYYYNKVLGAKESITPEKSFIKSVYFSKDAIIDNTQQVCTYTYVNAANPTGKTVNTKAEIPQDTTSVAKNCQTNPDSYAGATYKVDIVVETVQAADYKSITGWESAPTIS